MLRLLASVLLVASFAGVAHAQTDDAGEGSLAIPLEEVPTFDELKEDGAGAPPEEIAEEIEPPEVLRDLSVLPEPVRRMRELVVEAARSGDIERLRALIGRGDTQTQLSTADTPDDPIVFLKEASGDPEGHEIMAILLEILEAPFVRLDPDQDNEIYVWPYFAAYPIDRLSPEQSVELFRIITGGDYQEMVEFGAYMFYRVGIAPDGTWRFFVAGD